MKKRNVLEIGYMSTVTGEIVNSIRELVEHELSIYKPNNWPRWYWKLGYVRFGETTIVFDRLKFELWWKFKLNSISSRLSQGLRKRP